MDCQCMMFPSVSDIRVTGITGPIYVPKNLNVREYSYTIHILASFLKAFQITREHTSKKSCKMSKGCTFPVLLLNRKGQTANFVKYEDEIVITNRHRKFQILYIFSCSQNLLQCQSLPVSDHSSYPHSMVCNVQPTSHRQSLQYCKHSHRNL
jgi:hypothetical protein